MISDRYAHGVNNKKGLIGKLNLVMVLLFDSFRADTSNRNCYIQITEFVIKTNKKNTNQR